VEFYPASEGKLSNGLGIGAPHFERPLFIDADGRPQADEQVLQLVDLWRLHLHPVVLALGHEVGHAARGDEMALTDHHYLVGHLCQLGEQVARDEHAAAIIGQRAQQVAHPGDPFWVKSICRLVEDENPRISEEGQSQPEALGHAQGVTGGGTVSLTGQSHHLKYFIDPRSADVASGSQHAQVVARCASGVKGLGLDEHADLSHGIFEIGIGQTRDRGRAGIGMVQPDQHAHRGRLAGAVWTDESGERARVDLKGEIVDDDLLAVGLGEPHRPDHFNATPKRRYSLCGRSRGQGITEPVQRTGHVVQRSKRREDARRLSRSAASTLFWGNDHTCTTVILPQTSLNAGSRVGGSRRSRRLRDHEGDAIPCFGWPLTKKLGSPDNASWHESD